MTVPLHQLATDWTGQTYEQRLLLCVETLFAHGEIDRDQYDCLLAQIEARAAFERMQGAGTSVQAPSWRHRAARLAIDATPGLILASALAWLLWGQS